MHRLKLTTKQIRILIKVHQYITKYITHSTMNLDESLKMILKTVGSGFQCKYAILWFKVGGECLEYVAHWATPTIEKNDIISTLKQFCDADRNTFNHAISISNVKTKTLHFSSRPRNKRFRLSYDKGIKNWGIFPIIVDKQVMGYLEIADANRAEISEFTIRFAENICAQLGQFIKRRRDNEEVYKNEERYRTLVELAPDIIYSLTENNIISSLNNAFETITGLKKENFINKHLSELFFPEDREETMEKLELSRISDKYNLVQTRLNNKGNKQIFAELVESSFFVDRFEARRFGIIRDITEELTLEKQKDVWVAMASHELRTPLTSLKAFTQILQAKETDPTKMSYLNKINSITDNMTNIIDDFLDATKVNTNELVIEPTSFKLNELIKEIIESIQPSVEHKIVKNLDKEIKIVADRKRIRQLITNLITNAIKYSNSKFNVIVNTKIDNESVIISVRDFGIGIRKSEANKIFGAFYRSHGDTQSASGLGLGLFISQAIVNAHNGAIFVESEKNKGSTFYVQLPLTQRQAGT